MLRRARKAVGAAADLLCSWLVSVIGLEKIIIYVLYNVNLQILCWEVNLEALVSMLQEGFIARLRRSQKEESL